MARPKKGTKGAEESTRKWRETMQQKYGGADGVHNMMRIIGSKGGQAVNEKPKGFAAMDKEKVRAAGRKGGKVSRRTGVTTGQGKEKKYVWEGDLDAKLVFAK